MRLVPFSKATPSTPFKRDPYVPGKSNLAITEVDDGAICQVTYLVGAFLRFLFKLQILVFFCLGGRREKADHCYLHFANQGFFYT
jgi:hypothetical protein